MNDSGTYRTPIVSNVSEPKPRYRIATNGTLVISCRVIGFLLRNAILVDTGGIAVFPKTLPRQIHLKYARIVVIVIVEKAKPGAECVRLSPKHYFNLLVRHTSSLSVNARLPAVAHRHNSARDETKFIADDRNRFHPAIDAGGHQIPPSVVVVKT
jgi:hypothetical protein